jgi:hypothetical protein
MTFVEVLIYASAQAEANPTGSGQRHQSGRNELPGFAASPIARRPGRQWAVSVSGNCRVVFEFDGLDTTDVDLVDYH